MEKLTQMFEDINYNKQTDFQNVYFVVEKSGITTWGKYCQAVRELQTRINNFKSLFIKYKEKEFEIIETESFIKRAEVDKKAHFDIIEQFQEKDDFDFRESEIISVDLRKDKLSFNVMKLQDELVNIENELKSVKQVIEVFYKLSLFLKEKLHKQHGEITDEVKLQLEKDFWYEKIRQSVAIEILCNRSISSAGMESILALPINLKTKLLSEIKTPEDSQKLISSVMENDEDKIELTPEQIKKLPFDTEILNKYITNIESKYLQG